MPEEYLCKLCNSDNTKYLTCTDDYFYYICRTCGKVAEFKIVKESSRDAD